MSTPLSVLKARAISVVRTSLGRFETQHRRYRGWLKSVDGSVSVSGRPGYVYVQRRDTTGAQTEEIRMPDTNVPAIDGYPVIVGRTSVYRNEDVVIGRDTDTEESWLYDYVMEAHASQHAQGGFDTLWIQGRVIIPMRVNAQNTPDLTIDIEPGVYPTLTGNAWYDGATAYSMSAYIPDSGQRWVVIGINQSTDSVQVVTGTAIPRSRTLAWSDLPAIPSDMVTLAAIIMYIGQSAIAEDEIFEMRAFAGWAGTLAVQEDGVEVLDTATALNFTGDGVTVSVNGTVATILITGGGGTSIDVRDDGVLIVDGVTVLSFTGDGVSVAADGTTAVITIDAVAGANISVQDDGVLIVDGATVFNFTGDGIDVTGVGTTAHIRHFVPDHDHTGDPEDGGQITFEALSDVDTISDPPALNEVLKWDGVNWVPAPYNYEFEFEIASFTDNEASPQLIGAGGDWKAIGALTFDATYTNGPPTAAKIILSSDGGVSWGSDLNLSSPYLQVVSTEATAYPADKDDYIRFTLDADKAAENDTDAVNVYFRNWIASGVSAKASGYNSADVNGLGTLTVSNDFTVSVGVNPGAGEYIIFAYPDSYAAIHATGFLFNSITCPFEAAEVVSVTNTAGFTEDFKVYRSTLANLGNHTLVTSTTSNLTNLIFWGVDSKASGYTEADVEGLANSTASNDNTRTFTVTPGVSDYIIYAYPKRLGTVTFWVGGFEGGFEAPETVSVTNTNGYTEDYYVYRSTNVNLGETEVTTT